MYNFYTVTYFYIFLLITKNEARLIYINTTVEGMAQHCPLPPLPSTLRGARYSEGLCQTLRGRFIVTGLLL